jgi:protein phosphatase
MRGKNNEDRYGVSAYSIGEEDRTPSVFAIIADGIGGHRAGETAAEMAVNLISKSVAESVASDPPAVLAEAVSNASQAILEESLSDPSKKGMGATCIGAWVIGDRLYTVAVGDSRLYLIRSGSILRMNIDHTWIQEAIESGALTPEQAKGHPNAHVIRRYLGSPQPVVPDFRIRLNPAESDDEAETNQGLRLLPDDILLLCSDGLHDLVDDHEILQVISSQKMEKALETLVNTANERGGHDNITIVALQVPKTGAAQVFDTPTVVAEPEPVIANDVTQAMRRPAAVTPVKPIVRRRPASNTRLVWFTCAGLALVIGVILVSAVILGVLAIPGLNIPGAAGTTTSTRTVTVTMTTTRGLPTLPGFITTPVPQSTGDGGPFITLPPSGPPTPTYTPWPTNTRRPPLP